MLTVLYVIKKAEKITNTHPHSLYAHMQNATKNINNKAFKYFYNINFVMALHIQIQKFLYTVFQ